MSESPGETVDNESVPCFPVADGVVEITLKELNRLRDELALLRETVRAIKEYTGWDHVGPVKDERVYIEHTTNRFLALFDALSKFDKHEQEGGPLFGQISTLKDRFP